MIGSRQIMCLVASISCAAILGGYLLLKSSWYGESALKGHFAIDKTVFAKEYAAWNQISRANPHSIISFSIGCRQNRAAMESLKLQLMTISDPAHVTYGSYFSRARVSESLKNSSDRSCGKIKEWLSMHQVFEDAHYKHDTTGGVLHLHITVGQAERLLRSKFLRYQHKSSTQILIRADSYTLPLNLAGHVSFVYPITEFPTSRRLTSGPFISFVETREADYVRNAGINSTDMIDLRCNTRITPACLKSLYNIPEEDASPSPLSSIGIAGFLEENANIANAADHLKQFAPKYSNSTDGIPPFTVITVNGATNNQNNTASTGEAALDVQYAKSLAPKIPMTFYSIGGRGPLVTANATTENSNEPYLEMIHYLESFPSEKLPKVLSISYGDDEQSLPKAYAETVCNGFMRLGLRGVSVLVASGDNGVGDGGSCMTIPDPSTGPSKSELKFQPSFPASCPWVTVVGGTTGVSNEHAVAFSGGGFSNYFLRPSYQDSSVTDFLSLASTGTAHAGLYNREGRGYPDISAQARSFVVNVKGQNGLISGTSASTPVVAGIIALLNDNLLRHDKPALGFLNPWLYSLRGTEAVKEVTEGRNPGCGTDGFGAGPGWSPVTGLGTPNVRAMSSMLP